MFFQSFTVFWLIQCPPCGEVNTNLDEMTDLDHHIITKHTTPGRNDYLPNLHLLFPGGLIRGAPCQTPDGRKVYTMGHICKGLDANVTKTSLLNE